MIRPLIMATVTLLTSAASLASGQHPFERREPQAPLKQPVEVAVSINAQDAWGCHFGLNQTIVTQPQTEDRQDDGPQQTSRLIQNATLALRVLSIDEQSGTAKIEARFERLLVIAGTDGEQSEYRWSAQSPAEAPRTDLDRLLAALAGSTFSARVSPSGSVRGVVGYDAVNQTIEENPGVDRSALGLFAPAAIGSTLEMIWRPGAISGEKRNVQDAWSNTKRVSLGPIGGVAVEQAIVVDRIEDGILKAKGETDLHLLPPADPPSPGTPAIELIQHEGSIRIAWDLEQGRCVSASEKLDLKALWTLGPARLGVSMRTERSVALDSPPKGTKKPGQL